MYARRFLSLLGILVGLTLCGCGGSGSSGFDDFSENAVIDRALSTQRCVEAPTLTICPADAPLPAPVSIDTGLGLIDTVPCTEVQPANGCVFVLPFVPQGLSPATMYRVAVRRLDPNSEWSIQAESVAAPSQGMNDFTAPVEVDAAPTDQGVAPFVQLAVLAFSEPPTAIPAHVAQLADTGADFAFVTPMLRLQVQPQTAPGALQR